MSSVFGNQAEQLFSDMLFRNDFTDRPVGLEMMLITNPVTGITETTTYADLTEIPSNGYEYTRKSLADSAWVISNGVASYPPQTFILTSDYIGVTGVAIVTTGSSPKLLFSIMDSNAPVNLSAGAPYVVAVNVSTTAVTKGDISFFLSLLLKRDVAARGTDLSLALITSPSDINAKFLSELHEPSSVGGYMAVDIIDSSWNQNNSSGDVVSSCPAVVFTPTGSLFSSDIAGYAIVTKVAPFSVVAVELDPAQPVSIGLNTPYLVTPSIRVM